ncbi:hypothetical protein [Micromonospora endophytica]|uniref:hypothetical protein n=1 Tax=Micromonospora endophytica TaxID=515350 RepID=UPI001C32BA2E|nr:hypothetical protein [Micromonospora endophytica]BCJ62549.1 hypothetical protein Jiend_59710 [Micromonospora endophytica]
MTGQTIEAEGVEAGSPPGVRVDWRIPQPRPGLAGAVDRFFGPGRSRRENLTETAAHLLVLALLAAYVIRQAGGENWSVVEVVVTAVIAVDLVGGVLTNATNPAKRWYHRPGRRNPRLGFVAAHLAYPVVVALLPAAGADLAWLVANAALLVAAAVVIEFAAVEVKRLLAVALYLAAVLINLTWLPVAAAYAWFPLFFYLKLLVCFLVPEAPLVRANLTGSAREQR